MRTVEQAVGTLDQIALEPLVAGLSANAVAEAELAVGKEAALRLEDESLAFGHGIGLQPWHGRSKNSEKERHVTG